MPLYKLSEFQLGSTAFDHSTRLVEDVCFTVEALQKLLRNILYSMKWQKMIDINLQEHAFAAKNMIYHRSQ